MPFRYVVLLAIIAATSFGQATIDHLRNATAVSDRLHPLTKPDDLGPEPDPVLIGQLKREVREWLADRIETAPRAINPTQLAAQLEEAVRQVGLLVRNGDYEYESIGNNSAIFAW